MSYYVFIITHYHPSAGYENTYCTTNPHLLVKRLVFYDYVIVIHLSNKKKPLNKSRRAVGNFKCAPCRKMYCKAGVCSSKNFKGKYFLAPVLYHSDYEVMTIGVVITPREGMSFVLMPPTKAQASLRMRAV